jgi:hypothetical protein
MTIDNKLQSPDKPGGMRVSVKRRMEASRGKEAPSQLPEQGREIDVRRDRERDR